MTRSKWPRVILAWSNGHYVVAPPSLHQSLQFYEWEDSNVEVALAPDWLLEVFSKKDAATIHWLPNIAHGQHDQHEQHEQRTWADTEAAAERWLEYYASLAHEGTRNIMGYNLALQCWHLDLPKAEATPYLVRYWERVSTLPAKNPYELQEALGSLDSVYTDPRRKKQPAWKNGEGWRADVGDTAHACEERSHHIDALARRKDLLMTPNHAQDRIARTSFLRTDAWTTGRKGVFARIKNYNVSLREQEAFLPVEQAIATLRSMRMSTVLTCRIAMTIWNECYQRGMVQLDQSVFIRPEQILAFRSVNPDGAVYSKEAIALVIEDFLVASHLFVEGSSSIGHHNERRRDFTVGHYIIAEAVGDRLPGSERTYRGVWFRPGMWIRHYYTARNRQTAPVAHHILQLDPQNEMHALRLALYLTEYWRMYAKDRVYEKQHFLMRELLNESEISFDASGPNAKRSRKRILTALESLQVKGIVRSYECLDTLDEHKHGYNEAWCNSRWQILPPGGVVDALDTITKYSPRTEQRQQRAA